jgi:bisphosphoglycerate-independent phosphoglycerate mutase (AlkP superfamily)
MVRPTCLVIIDGWGITENDQGNAILHAKTPNMDALTGKVAWGPFFLLYFVVFGCVCII